MFNDSLQIIITGSSGFVGKSLSVLLKRHYSSIKYVDINSTEIEAKKCNISDPNFLDILNIDKKKPSVIVNLAAARFDFGVKAKHYFNKNVYEHELFLKNIERLNIIKFIHISSVASIDGKDILYSNSLNCDDAYRSTKFLQEDLISKWCKHNNIDNIIIYPSAIFSDENRNDTNIGKLQAISKILRIFPRISTKKSLTYLPNLNNFILSGINNEIKDGKYLAIENPILSVSEIVQCINKNIFQIKIPFLKQALHAFSYLCFILGGFGKIDTKITPNRVIKLFSDTSYQNINREDIDIETYNVKNHEKLNQILVNFSQD